MTTLTVRSESAAARRANGGFSLIEVLVAALLLLVIALGLIPLFTRAMVDNANGRDATTATNFDRTRIETLNALPFDTNVLTVPAGQLLLETNESYSRGTLNVDNDSSEGWQAGVPVNLASVRWTRRTRVRYFPSADYKSGALTNNMTGDAPLSIWQLKSIEVTVQGANRSLTSIGNVLGGGPEVTFTKVVSFS